MQKHKILAFLLALLVSIALWFYAVTVVNPNDTTRVNGVRVRIVGTTELANKGLMLTGGLEQYIDVEISGRRSDLKELNSSSLEAVADVSNIDSAGRHDVTWTLDPPSTVASGDISVTDAVSTKITVQVSEYIERPEIPVKVEFEGELSSDYVRDPAILNMETISVSGPVEEVSAISAAVVTVNLDGATEPIVQEMDYRFVNSDGETLEPSEFVTTSSETVRVSVPILRYKQVSLTLRLLPGGGATEEDVTYEINPPTIGVTGSEDALSRLNQLVIREVDLAQTVGPQSWTVTPELPAGVTNRASKTSVEVTLRFNGLRTRNFTIPMTEIRRINDNPDLEFGEQSVTVQVRGKSSALQELTDADIQIVADMSTYDPATKTIELTVSLPGDSSTGVIGGPYTVQIIETEGD